MIGSILFYLLSKGGDHDVERKRSIPRVRSEKLVYKEPESQEYFSVFDDISKLDLYFLYKFRPFQCLATSKYVKDYGSLKREYIDDENKLLKPLTYQPDVFPIQLKA